MDEPLTIALVSTQRRWQGGEEQAWQLARGLRERGHQCLILAQRGAPFAARLKEAGFDVIELSGKLPLPWRVWSIRRSLRKSAVDVVHVNDAHAITLGGLAAMRMPGVATIASRRASFSIRSPGRYRSFCDRVFCVSSYAADRCVDAGIPRGILRVIHDGVDPQRAQSGCRRRGRESLGLSDHDFLLLSVGSLVECKGHCHLIEAMPDVLDRIPSAQLVIAGAGDQEEALREQIERLGLRSFVRLLGFRDDVPDLIHACDLFVFPSTLEGLGSTLIDVMLAGRPIITTTAGGIPDVTGPPQAGRSEYAWIVEPGDPQALSHAILAASDQSDVSARMVRRSRQRAEAMFTVDQMVDATIHGYREALAQKRIALG
jgi:glycosyltransferase involved in cell wall biosynthesis